MNRLAPLVYLVALVPCLLLVPSQSRATWPQNGAAINTAASGQTNPKAVSDGAGGAIIVWEDQNTTNIMGQRVDAMGIPQWTVNGVVISFPGGSAPQLIPDGAGGAIVTWFRSGDVQAQRVNSAGVVQWTVGGVNVSAATGAQQLPVICSDNAGGAIISWQDFRGGTDYDVYAQRINGSGVAQWTANGVGAAIAANQTAPQITADNFGGAVVARMDTRNGNLDIYVQRFGPTGTSLWGVLGVGLCTATDNQGDPSIVSDGSGGAIVAWEDNRNLNNDIFVRRISSGGVPQWTANGVALCTLTNNQWNVVLLADGSGGVFAAWEDQRNAGIADVYVQRVNSAGTAQWAANGVALATSGTASEPEIVTDGLGGAIVGWTDTRAGSQDIYARRINGTGVAQWTANGVALCTAGDNQRLTTIASDGVGGAIAAFEDSRTGGVNDIYAQRVERNGYWGYPAPDIHSVRDIPGDQGGVINLAWDASRLDLFPDEVIQTYTVWRAIDSGAAAMAIEAGAARVRDGIDPLPSLSAGREVVRMQQLNGVTYFWKQMSTIPAFHLTGYADVVPTLFDSTATSAGPHYFQVIAHAAVGQWISSPASGRSVDNVAPAPPLQLAAQRVGTDVHLVWNKNDEPDLHNYAVYRKSSSGVTPIPLNFLSDAEDTILVDASAPNTSLYYIVTAIDLHDNQSPPSNEAAVSPVTGVGDAPRSYALSVSNYPNPFNPQTTVSYTVPSRGPVTIAIYDANGARLATLLDHTDRATGAYTIEWDGRAQNGATVGSGVYFARIKHASGTRTKKMVLLK